MKLIIFDIDGTILDSVNADDRCFIQTFRELHQIELANANWNNFTNVTDSGLTNEIFKRYKGKEPTPAEVTETKLHFKNLLSECQHQFTEIRNALNFIEELSASPNFKIAFATGGWKDTAMLKCASIGLELNNYLHKTADDHYNRAEIIRLAVHEAFIKNYEQHFESVIYFGDGLWDMATTKELSIDFIGVDVWQNGKLRNASAEKVINDYSDTEKILNWVETSNRPLKTNAT